MASTDEIIREVITPMAALFGKPYGCKTDEEVALAKAQYIEALTHFPADALRGGWADVRRGWVKTTWPPVAHIANASREHIPAPPKPDRGRADDEVKFGNRYRFSASEVDAILADYPTLSDHARRTLRAFGQGVEPPPFTPPHRGRGQALR